MTINYEGQKQSIPSGSVHTETEFPLFCGILNVCEGVPETAVLTLELSR
jgi:hypothetical protein